MFEIRKNEGRILKIYILWNTVLPGEPVKEGRVWVRNCPVQGFLE